MTVTLYASILAIWLVILSTRVIALRGNPVFKWFAFGYNSDEGLNRSIRAQGNLTEYAPIFIILLLLAEVAGFPESTLHYYGAVFVIGRLMHGLCFGFMQKSMALRIGGTVLTLFPILGLAVANLTHHFSL